MESADQGWLCPPMALYGVFAAAVVDEDPGTTVRGMLLNAPPERPALGSDVLDVPEDE